MSKNGSILFRRGPTADRKAFTPLKGEAIYDTDQQVFYVGDGQTQGGNPAFNDKITVDDDGNVTSILLTDPNNTRPAPAPGLIRYNNESSTLEYSDGSDFFLLGSSPFNSITNVLYVSPNGKDDDTFKEMKGRTPGTAFKTLNRACREAEAIIKNGAKGLGPYQKFITYDAGSGQQKSVINSIADNAPYKNLNITNGGTNLDATAELRSGFRVIGQTSGAIGIIEEYNVPGGLTDQLVVDVESGEFQTGEQLKFGSAIPSTPYVSGVQSIPEITIFVETGIYYEHFPIRVPVNTSIKGDEFRRSIIRPQPGMSNSSYADIGFKRDAANLDGYSGVEPRPFGRHYTTDYTSRIYPFIANEGGYTAEVELIRDNKQSLIDQTIAYISSTYPSLDYNETKCRRDAGLIIDGLVFDLEYGEYNGTLNAGLAYYGQAAYLPADQVTPTADSIDQLATYINNLLTTPAVETIVTNYVGGVAEIIRGNNFNQPKNNEELDVFLMNDATIIRNITVQQHGGFMEVLDPVGQIKTRSPYTQTASSFSRSKAPDVSFAGGMFVDGFCGNLDARFVQANSTTEIVIDSVDREPQAPTSFYVDGTRFQINKVDTVGVSAGQYRVLLDTSTPWDVAYYQIVNSGDPLPTLPLDIEILTAGNISMLSNDFTQINDLGYGLWVTNGARSEAVSVFTYYCHIAYLSENGADIRSLNGSCGYGDFALVARGSDPLETADEVNLSENTVQIATINTAGAFAANNQEGDLQVFVDGYSYEPFNVSEIEIDHNGAANANGDTFGIVRYEITGFTATTTPGVIQLNIASAGNNDTSTTGLKTDVPNNTDIIIRNGQVIKIGNVIDINPTRPSTALVYQDDPNTVYRVLSYDTAGLPANTAKVTLRETYDYVKPIVDTTAGSVPGSGQVGDTTVRLEVDLDNNERSRIEAAQAAGNPYQFGFNGTIHSITAFRSKAEVGAAYAEIDITPGLTKDLSTFSDTVTFRAGPQAGQAANITVGISTLRATSHDMLDIGSGSFQSTNYPSEIFGAPQIAPDQSKEVVEENKGRVFFVTSDQDGNFRVGDFFKVDQGTGTVTFAASIALSNLDGIGFKRGVAISEFSTDDAMTDNASDTVPTESAVLGYVGRRLGLTDSNVERSDKIGSGFLDLGGVQAMQAPINMNTNTINNLVTPTGANQATNKSYVDSKTFEVNAKSSTVDGSITLVTDDIAEDGSPTNLYYTQGRFDTAFGNKSTSNLSEGTNLYYTQGRFDTAFTAKSTTDLSEGTNLYYTNERVDDRIATTIQGGSNISVTYNDATNQLVIAAITGAQGYDLSANSTDDLAEGAVRLYYTRERVEDAVANLITAGSNITLTYTDNGANPGSLSISASNAGGYDLSNNDTDDLGEGSSNLYFTASRFNTEFAGKTTDDVNEGSSNLYYTNERVDDRVNSLLVAGTGISKTYDDGSNSLTLNLDFTEFNTSNITENTNLYYTDARARSAISVSGDLGYNSGTGVISFTERTDAQVRGLVSASDAGGDGSFAYNSTTGVFTYTGPSASDVRAHFSAGTGITITTGEIAIGQAVSTTSNVTFNDLTVDGNLTVNGTTTTLNTETLTVDDAIIVLNNNKSGAPGTETVGIEVERGSGTNVQLRWNDGTDVWEITTDGTTYETIATTVDVSEAAENDYVNSASFATGTGVLTLSRLGGTDVTVDLDGRYLTAESDTLSSVLGRGNTANTNIEPDATANNRNLGASARKWNTVYATTFEGTTLTSTTLTTGASSTAGSITGNWSLTTGSRLQATYADIAEMYSTDKEYEPGTIVMFGGEKELTIAKGTATTKVAGVITTNPAFIMNQECEGQAIALKGRIPVKVIGKVNKGDFIIASNEPGVGIATDKYVGGAVIGKAIETKDTDGIDLVEVKV